MPPGTFYCFFTFFLSPLFSQITRKEKKRETKNKILEALRGSDNNTTNKDIDETNLIISRKVTNDDQRVSYEPSEDK